VEKHGFPVCRKGHGTIPSWRRRETSKKQIPRAAQESCIVIPQGLKRRSNSVPFRPSDMRDVPFAKPGEWLYTSNVPSEKQHFKGQMYGISE
jgi:hypothetical protein